MKIRFDSGGGVTGPAGRRSCEVDTDRLPPAEAAEVRSLLAAADLSAAAPPAERAPARQRPDEMYYDISVEDGGVRQSVSFTSRTAPAAARPLIAWLNKWAVKGSQG